MPVLFKMAELRIVQKTPHNGAGTSFLMPKILAKFQWGYLQWGCQLLVG